MEFELKHYRRATGSSIGVLVEKHPLDGVDANAAVGAARQFLDDLVPGTDFAILKDDHGKYIRGWGVNH